MVLGKFDDDYDYAVEIHFVWPPLFLLLGDIKFSVFD